MSISTTPRGGAFTARGGWAATTPFYQDDFCIWQGAEWQSLLPYNLGNQPDLSPFAWLRVETAAGQGILLDDFYDSPIYASKSQAINAAVSAAKATGINAISMRARTYILDTAPLQIFANSPLTIFANGATLQAQWGNIGCIFFVRVADYDEFTALRIYGTLTLDANNITPASTSCVLGNLGNGGVNNLQRVNFSDIFCEDLRIINVPTITGSGVTHGVSLWSRHKSPNEAVQTHSLRVRIRANIQGANYGCDSLGSPGSKTDPNCTLNSTATVLDPDVIADDVGTGVTGAGIQAGTTILTVNPGVSFTMSLPATITSTPVSLLFTPTYVNFYMDQQYWDITHDSRVDFGSIQNTGGGNQFGGGGFGGLIEVHIDDRNAADVALEIDGFQKADVWGRTYNPRNLHHLATNFNPVSQGNQQYTYHSTLAIVPAGRIVGGVSPSQAFSYGYMCGSTSSACFPFGEMILEDCVYLALQATVNTGIGSAIVVPSQASGKRLTISGTFTAEYPNVADVGGATVTRCIYMIPSASEFTLRGGHIRIRYAGSIVAGAQMKAITFSPQGGCIGQLRMEGGSISFDASLSGGDPSAIVAMIFGLSTATGGHLRGTLGYLGWAKWGGLNTDTPSIIQLRPSTDPFTIDGSIKINHLDLSQDPQTTPLIIGGGATDTINRVRFHVNRIDYPGIFMVATATSAQFTPAVFTSGVPSVYIGNIASTIYMTGGTGITSVQISKNGGSTFINVLTQAAAAIGALAFEIENGDQVTVNGTTMPTITVARHRTGM